MVGDRERHPKLSKSRYIAGLQCELKLWNLWYAPQLASPASPALEERVEIGRAVGLLATQRHPGGRSIAPRGRQHSIAVQHTRLAMAQPGIPALFEAAFTHKDVRVRVDILERAGPSSWDLLEVKSASKVKDINVDDVAVQYWVLTGAGVPIERAGVLTLDRDYVYAGGAYDTQRLFVFHDLTEDVRGMLGEVDQNVRAMIRTLARSTPPDVQPGELCHAPFECEFWEHCTRDVVFPEHPVTDLPYLRGARRQKLAALEVDQIPDIPNDIELTALQQRVRDCVRDNQEFVSESLAAALQEPAYPIHHLRIETLRPALPRYRGTRPSQTLPFQWSDHVEHADGIVEHHEYICRRDEDPRREFVESLLAALGSRGTICVYSQHDERVFRELAAALPEHARQVEGCCRRIWDLRRVVRTHFYSPALHGSFGLGQVLTVLAPGEWHGDLDLPDETSAARAYLRSLESKDAAERDALRDSLLASCRRDTAAMVALRGALRDRA